MHVYVCSICSGKFVKVNYICRYACVYNMYVCPIYVLEVYACMCMHMQ